jgi:phosphohistidine phosphatase
VTGRDIDRRLIERGRSDSKRIGEEIRSLGLEFDRVVSSPAARAAETAQLAGLESHFDDRIYDAAASELLAIIQETGNEIDRLAMVGHNPGFERLASRLIGHDVEMPTGSLMEIEVPVARWNEIDEATGRLVRFVKPKELR